MIAFIKHIVEEAIDWAKLVAGALQEARRMQAEAERKYGRSIGA